jgi:GIY-YIG catalytic domain-containing protein
LKRAINNSEPISVKKLRRKKWKDIPTDPGMYWWYFPKKYLRQFEIPYGLCLDVRDGKVCLYCGIAKSLSSRAAWHAAQKLTPGALRSRFLSTLRFTLLALNDFDYVPNGSEIDDFMDLLSLRWQPTKSRSEAESLESRELRGEFRYPLNIKGNLHVELQEYILELKRKRAAYRARKIAQLFER